MPGLIGRKIGMTSVFSADGKNIPCTVIEVGPCVVTQVKTVEKDGYKAYQLGFGEAKENRTSQPMMGIFKKAGTTLHRNDSLCCRMDAVHRRSCQAACHTRPHGSGWECRLLSYL